MQVCVSRCNWCNWGTSLWDCPQYCDNPKHECGLPQKMFVDTSRPEAPSWGEGKPMHVLQSEVLHVSSMSTKEDWLVDLESNPQKWTWGQWIKVQAENFMCIPLKNTLFIELTLGALYVVDLQERPRNHLDMRHRLDSQGQREGKVIDYKWEHLYNDTMLTFFCLLLVVRMEIFQFLWEILHWTKVVIHMGLFLSVFCFFLFCSESCLSSRKRVLSATSEKGQCRTTLVSSICILGRSYV